MDIKLRRELKNCISFIELGCGSKSPAVGYIQNKYSVGVDRFLPSLKANKKQGYFKDYVLADLTSLPFKQRSFDCAAAFDVIEHLTKTQGNKLINEMEKISSKKTVISTPNGFNSKCHLEDNNPLQIHKCGWTMNEFIKRGYAAFGIDGVLSFRGEYALATIKPEIFGALISRLSDPFVYKLPSTAFHLLCIKKIENCC
jgi:ubiquinone/menaquinone biosynthesis C-methylase UbiE